MPNNRSVHNQISVVIGKHINCDKLNMWDGAELDSYTFEDKIAREMHKKVRDFILDSIKENMNKTRDILSL